MKRISIVVAAAIGLALLSACSDDPEPTTVASTATVAPTATTDQGSTAATVTVAPEPEPTATEAAAPEPTAATQPQPTAPATPTTIATPEPQPTATAVPTPAPTATPQPQATAITAPTAAPEPQATATTVPTAAATAEPRPTATTVPTPTATPTATAQPAAKEPSASGGDITFTLDELEDSGQTGTATLTAVGDTTLVELTLSAGASETELVHIHTGQCGDTLAGVAHALTNFVGGDGASVTAVDATLDSLLTGGFAINSHMSGNPGVYTACGNIPAKGQSVSVALDELNASGQSGTATLTSIGDTTIVELTLTTGSLETELVHIHTGQCGESLAGVAHPLTNFVDGSGASVTTVDASLASLLTGGFAINSHESGNPATYTACGNIPAVGETVSFALDELNASGQSGTATLTAIGDATVVKLTLSSGALETELVHIHTGQCGDTLAGVAHPLTNFVDGSGSSVTTVDVALDSLLTGGFAVNSHENGNPANYTACGNIPGPTQVSIQQFRHPDVVVAVGTTVRWTNLDQSTHTVTLGSNGVPSDGFDSGFVRGGATFEFTFDTPGTFAYTCTIHPNMNATIQVGEATPVVAGNPLYNLF